MNKLFHCCLYCFFFGFLAIFNSKAFAQQNNMPKALLGISMANGTKTYQQSFSNHNGNGAITIKKVVSGSAAEKQGLKKGDILYAIDDKKINKNNPVSSFKDILKQYQPDDKIIIKGFRIKKFFQVGSEKYSTLEKASQQIAENLDHEITIKQIDDIQKIQKDVVLGSWQQMPKLTHMPDSISVKWQDSIERNQKKYSEIPALKQIESTLFQSRMKGDALINIPGSDPLEFYLHNNPQMLLGTGISIKNLAVENRNNLVEKLLTDFYITQQPAAVVTYPLPASHEEYIGQLKELITKIKSHTETLQKFYNKYSNPLQQLKQYYQAQDDSNTPSNDVQFQKKLKQISLLIKKYQPQSNSLLLNLSYFFNDERNKLLPGLFSNSTLPMQLELNGMSILISGSNNDSHYQGADMIIELGGDDNYFVTKQSQSKPIIVDLSGNDIYMSKIAHQWGAAEYGISYLLDVTGNDHYFGQDFSMGSAFVGAGLLEDRQGNDSYFAAHLSMGTGLLGVGILSDHNGNDTYVSGTFSQAAGLFMGQGYLIEKNGNDRYISTAWKSGSYQKEASFDGISMGVGFGIRDIARGGIGILFDYKGDDYYHAGNFSLGCGYYFAIGGLIDLEGNDNYQAMRYGIGTAVHSASGFFIDASGNDHYYASQHAIAGAAWDLSSALFIDFQGDDQYNSNGPFPFSFAAAEHNSLAIHLDKEGDDNYHNGFFSNQSNSYHNGQSFGIFINLFGNDNYPEPFKNDHTTQINEFYFGDH